jgi:hypothetical protein
VSTREACVFSKRVNLYALQCESTQVYCRITPCERTVSPQLLNVRMKLSSSWACDYKRARVLIHPIFPPRSQRCYCYSIRGTKFPKLSTGGRCYQCKLPSSQCVREIAKRHCPSPNLTMTSNVHVPRCTKTVGISKSANISLRPPVRLSTWAPRASRIDTCAISAKAAVRKGMV